MINVRFRYPTISSAFKEQKILFAILETDNSTRNMNLNMLWHHINFAAAFLPIGKNNFDFEPIPAYFGADPN